MTIGQHLRALRISADLTQTQVGERFNPPITKQRIGKIESSDDLQYSTVEAYLAAVGYEIQIIPSPNKTIDMERNLSYSIIFSPGTPDEYIEENDLTLEDALAQIEEMKEQNPEINAAPYARLASASKTGDGENLKK